MIRQVLRSGNIELKELDAIVLGNGPGSFIGMRIAASVAQGLAYGAGLKIAAVSSLAGVAAEVFAASDADEAIIAQDAHMSEIYLGAYRRRDDGVPELMFPERLHGHMIIDELDTANPGRRVAAGSGWQRYPQIAAINSAAIGEQVDILYPRARFLLALGADALQRGQSIDPADIAPAYLRPKVAEKPDRRVP
jgi:tRNA threonylcarbamoyladenosine biosynthesis protein TsaB